MTVRYDFIRRDQFSFQGATGSKAGSRRSPPFLRARSPFGHSAYPHFGLNRGAVLFLLGRGLLASDENTFPGFKERIIKKCRDRQIHQLEQTPLDVSSAGDKSANPYWHGKWL